MYIDFHTHIFPDALAVHTIPKLAAVCGLEPSTNGTAAGLLASMSASGTALSVVLPVVTKPSQFDSVNAFAEHINDTETKLLSFGGIHPDCDGIEQKLDTLVQKGFQGIKLHPDYQGVMIDDDRNLRILQGAIDRGLYVTIHAGVDIGLPSPVHCPPDRMRRVLDMLSFDRNDPHIILAHTGGYAQWDDVENLLVGQSVLLDISFSLGRIPDEQLLRIIRHHGAERVLFATDTPWSDQASCIAHFERLPLTTAERDAVAFGNASRILGKNLV